MTEPALELQLDPATYRSGRLQELHPSQVGRLVEFRIAVAKQIPDVELGFHLTWYELSKIRDSLHEGQAQSWGIRFKNRLVGIDNRN